ncbi:hypothetical protein ACVDG5_029240 [Mesorhizobium sp. ORM6]
MILFEIVHVLDDLDADNFLGGPEGKREELQGIGFRPGGDADTKMAA